MKNKLIYTILFFITISCTNIDRIDKSDYRKIDETYQYNILKEKLKNEGYKDYDKVIDIIYSQYKTSVDKVKVQNIESLITLMLNDVEIKDENKINELYSLNSYDKNNIFNYLSLFELKRGSLKNAYNDAWIAKTREDNYLSNELFIYMLNDKENTEEILYDMEKKFKDYPLNKYNRLTYNTLIDIDKIKITDFNEVRKDLKKIDPSFYPELEVYKIKLLMIVDLMEANYLYHIKDFMKLKELKMRVNSIKLDDELDLSRFNGFVDHRLKEGN